MTLDHETYIKELGVSPENSKAKLSELCWLEFLNSKEDYSTTASDAVFDDFGSISSNGLEYIIPSILASVLRVTVVLVGPISKQCCIFPIFPKEMYTTFVVYLLLNEESYTLLLTKAGPAAVNVFCRCGGSDKKERRRCNPGMTCPCRRAGQECHSNCKCKTCANNKKVTKDTSPSIKRRKRDMEGMMTGNQSSSSFTYALQHNFTITTPISYTDSLLLESLMHFICQEYCSTPLDLDVEFIADNLIRRHENLYSRRHMEEIEHFPRTILLKEQVKSWINDKKSYQLALAV